MCCKRAMKRYSLQLEKLSFSYWILCVIRVKGQAQQIETYLIHVCAAALSPKLPYLHMASAQPRLSEDLIQQPKLNSKALLIYAFGQLFLIVLLLLNILFNWSNYCYWRLGLLLGNCYLSKVEGPHFQHEYTLADIHSDVCDSEQFRQPIEDICPHFCSNLDKAKAAGIACFVLNLIVICMNAGLSYLHFESARTNRLFRRKVLFLLFLPFVLCFIQLFVYPFASNMPGASHVLTDKAPQHIMKPMDFSIAGGYVVAIIITVSQLASALSSLYPHRKLYLQDYRRVPSVELAQ